MIESKLVVDRYIDQIVVIADQRKFVSALIVPEYNLLKEFAERHHIRYADTADLCRNADINKMLLFRINTLQQEFAHYEQVKRITLLPEPFIMFACETAATAPRAQLGMLSSSAKPSVPEVLEVSRFSRRAIVTANS